MKKVIKLNESDVERLVKKIIREGISTEDKDLKIQTRKFMTMLAKNGQIAPYLKRLADASELAKAQAVALFAENLGLEPSKIGSLVSTLKQQVKDTQSQDSEQGMEGENFED
tara:strand:- start:123 stop:458 length:336 start_codon:yes stop_codon:yes gene_type:complete